MRNACAFWQGPEACMAEVWHHPQGPKRSAADDNLDTQAAAAGRACGAPFAFEPDQIPHKAVTPKTKGAAHFDGQLSPSR